MPPPAYGEVARSFKWRTSSTKALGLRAERNSLEDQAVLLGITWRPTPDGVFTRFHVSDVWLDDVSIQRAARNQTETHKAFIRSRWMPGWIDAVEYGKFGTATVTATLFGGMDDSLYADFKKGVSAMMNPVENTLKHTHGAYGPRHMACRGPHHLRSQGSKTKPRWEAAAYRLRSRQISSSKVSVPGGLSVSVREAGPKSKYHARNTSEETNPKSVSLLLTSFQSTKIMSRASARRREARTSTLWRNCYSPVQSIFHNDLVVPNPNVLLFDCSFELPILND